MLNSPIFVLINVQFCFFYLFKFYLYFFSNGSILCTTTLPAHKMQQAFCTRNSEPKFIQLVFCKYQASMICGFSIRDVMQLHKGKKSIRTICLHIEITH